MKSKSVLAARFVLGMIFVVFGLNGFLQFLPMPPLPEAAGQFMGALAASGYMFPMIKSIEIVAGAMILAGVQLPLALLLLAPIVVNIFAFHWFLTGPSSVGMAVVIVLLMAFLAKQHWSNFGPIFKKQG